MQTQIRRRRMWPLIRVYTVCLQHFLLKIKKKINKIKSIPDIPKTGNGLIHLIRMEKSNRQMWVKDLLETLRYVAFIIIAHAQTQ